MISLGAAPPDLTGLYSIFGTPLTEVPHARFCPAEEVPEPFRRLLDHEEHMTVRMEERHGSPLRLKIIEETSEGNWYARKILLLHGANDRVLQFGIMRFNFDWCSPEIREAIRRGDTPVGRILIEHDVLRRISTHALMKIVPNAELREVFGLPARQARDGSAPRYAYGRLATIYCNEEPAVDLLEIPSPSS